MIINEKEVSIKKANDAMLKHINDDSVKEFELLLIKPTKVIQTRKGRIYRYRVKKNNRNLNLDFKQIYKGRFLNIHSQCITMFYDINSYILY